MIAVLKTIITRSFVRFVVVLNLEYSKELTFAESEIGLDYLFLVVVNFFLASRASWSPFEFTSRCFAQTILGANFPALERELS